MPKTKSGADPGASRYSNEDRARFVMHYLANGGSGKQAAISAGIEIRTGQRWVTSPWFKRDLASATRTYFAQHLSEYRGILDTTLGEIRDRLEHGDEVQDKTGGLVRRKVSSADLTKIANLCNNQMQNFQNNLETEVKEESDKQTYTAKKMELAELGKADRAGKDSPLSETGKATAARVKAREVELVQGTKGMVH